MICLVMSLNVFITICVLACDFLIYVFFQWTFGEKYRRRIRRSPLQKHPQKNAVEIPALRPYVVAPRSQRHLRQTEREVA
jgi:hypothetical protein